MRLIYDLQSESMYVPNRDPELAIAVHPKTDMGIAIYGRAVDIDIGTDVPTIGRYKVRGKRSVNVLLEERAKKRGRR